MSIVLFGPPGAGKGTQSSLIVSNTSYVHISTGDLFRAAMKDSTPLGLEAKSYVDAGRLVPDSVTIGLVREFLEQHPGKGFIFDGFPRNEAQAEALESLITELGASSIKTALFLEVPKDTLMTRLTGRRLCRQCGEVYHIDTKPTSKTGVCDKCGGEVYQRKDDSGDVIATRLEAYEESTKPLKEYYSEKALFKAIDGLGSSSEVFERVKEFLE